MAGSNEKIWIIGGSAGIGAALAEAYAQRGATLVLSGRDQAALDQQVAKLGPGHSGAEADIGDRESLERVARQFGPFERVIVTAAIYDPGPVMQADADKAAKIFATNLGGTFNAVRAAVPSLRQGGQLVLFGSAAAIFGLPNGQVYSATKAGIVNLAQSLRSELWPAVDTRLTDQNTFAMPAMLEVEDAAARIIKGLDGKRFEIAFPRRLIWPLRLLARLPHAIAFALAGRLKG